MSCPSCDGTIARAIQQGREVTTWERCEACAVREARLLDGIRRDALIVQPTVRFGVPHDHREVVEGCFRCELSADEVGD